MPRNPSLLVALLAILLIAPGLGNRDFSTRGEPREALVAQSIAEGNANESSAEGPGAEGPIARKPGGWILGTGYGGSVPSKPPLTHWLTALVSYPLGEVTPATARFPSAFACVLAVALFGGFVARRFGAFRGWVTAILLLTSVEWFRASFVSRVDMTLAATLTGGFLALYQWEERKRTSIPWLAILMFSLAALTKGPVAIVLPGLIFALHLFERKESLSQVVRSGVLLFAPVLLVVGLWYVAAFLERQGAFIDKIWYENIQRFLGTQEDEPHKKSAVYLWGSLLLGLLPWSLMLLGRVKSSLTAARDVLAAPRSISLRLRSWWHQLDPFERYSLIVLISFLIFFSIPGSKRSVYLLPAYPFAAFLLSGLFDPRSDFSLALQRILARGLAFATLLISSVFAVILLFPEVVLTRLNDKTTAVDAAFYLDAFSQYFREASFGTWIPIVVVVLIAGALLVMPPRLRGRVTPLWLTPFVPLATLVCVLCAVGNWILFPPAVNGLSSKEFADALPVVVLEQDTLYSFGTEFYGLSFYSKIPIFRFEEKLPESGVLVLNEEDLPRFKLQTGGALNVTPILRSATPITRPSDFVVVARFERKQAN